MVTLDQTKLNKARRLIRRGNFRLQAGEYKEAFDTFEKTLEYFPNSTEILKTLGKIRFKQGNYKEAIRTFRDCLGIEETDEVKELLASSLLLDGQYESAREIFLTLENQNDKVKALRWVTEVLLDGDINQAIAELNKLRVNYPFVDPFIGFAHYHLGQYSYAIRYFRSGSNWKYSHALALQYLYTNSQRIAMEKFTLAKRQYMETTSERDQAILYKIEFDQILCLTPETRLSRLLELREKYKSNIHFYLALLATEYELNGFSTDFGKYLDEAQTIENIPDDIHSLLNIWDSVFKKEEEQ